MEAVLRDLDILKVMKMKPNYSELARVHNVSRDTIRKYDNGYKGKPSCKPKVSKLDKYKDEIRVKLAINGVNVSSVYRYILEKDSSIGSESNFRKYVNKHNLKSLRTPKARPRFETPPGFQLQFDWKERISLVSKYGEVFEFNVLTSVLGNSRKHIFEYSKTRTKEDVIRCLINTFKQIDGVPKRCLTDNMSSIITNGKFHKEFVAFANDFGFTPEKCRVYSPETKGKVESKNRFINWLLPYNNEFEDEEELISIIKKIEHNANEVENKTTLLPPNLLYAKEKEHLSPLPTSRIIESYIETFIAVKVSKESLIHYKKCKYSVPSKYINKTVKLKEIDGTLNIYSNGLLIRQHSISRKPINYNEDDYVEIFKEISDKDNIEEFALRNLELLDKIGEI